MRNVQIHRRVQLNDDIRHFRVRVNVSEFVHLEYGLLFPVSPVDLILQHTACSHFTYWYFDSAGIDEIPMRMSETCPWLPVHQRVTFKIAVLVIQRLAGQAPTYLADDCQLTSDINTRRLRSTDTATCVVRQSNNRFGDRCFAAAGPRVWSMLPIHLQLCDRLEQFKRLLKTHLFGV